MRKIFIFYLIIFSSLNTPQPSFAQSRDVITLNQDGFEPLIFNRTEFIDGIIKKLSDYATWEADYFLGWPLSHEGFDDGYFERSYRNGLTGIGDFYLDLIESNYSFNDTIVKNINTHLLTSYEQNEYGIFWTRFTNLVADAWTSYRYGTAGFLSYLSRANKYYNLINLQKVYTGSMDWLASLQLPSGEYPMVRDSYVTTDLEYGATGIAKAFLKLYLNTGNQTFLATAKSIGTWLCNHGSWNNGQYKLPWTTYGADTQFEGTSYKSVSTGVAGTLMVLLDLYKTTNETLFFDTAKGIGEYLISTEKNGIWDKSAVDYVTKIGDNDDLIGYFVGSSGIAIQLLRLYDLTENTEILGTTNRVHAHILGLLEKDGSIPISMERTDIKYTGFSMGASGVAYYFLQLYQRDGMMEDLNAAIKIVNHLFILFENNGLIPYDESNLERGFSFNLDTGLAGIGRVVLNLVSLVPDSLFSNVSPHTSYQQPSGNYDDNWLLWFVGGLNIIMIIFLIYRKNRKL